MEREQPSPPGPARRLSLCVEFSSSCSTAFEDYPVPGGTDLKVAIPEC